MATGGHFSGSLSKASDEVFDFCCSICYKDGINIEAVNQCLDCNEFFCEKCISFHNKLGLTSGHKVVGKDQMSKVASTKPKIPLRTQRCPDHHKSITKYCTNHDVICCDTCVSVSHKNCDGITYIVDVAQGITTLGCFPKEYKAKLKGNYYIKVKNDKEKCDSPGSCLLPDGTLVVTDWTNKRLKRLDASYSVTDHCDMPGEPYGVTCTAPDEVAVTLRDMKKVQFVSVRGSMSLTRSFSTSDTCMGICYSADELFVVCGGVYEEGPGHVAVYNINDARIRTIQTDPSGQQLFSFPFHITASPDGARIYVADCDKGVVSSDRSGKSVSSITDPSLKNAWGVCTLDNGNVLVCGFSSHNVLQFDGYGRCLGELLSRADDIQQPKSLSYDSSRARLIVTMFTNNKIKVFDLVKP